MKQFFNKQMKHGKISVRRNHIMKVKAFLHLNCNDWNRVDLSSYLTFYNLQLLTKPPTPPPQNISSHFLIWHLKNGLQMFFGFILLYGIVSAIIH